MHTVIGTYKNMMEAQKVVTALDKAGIPRDDISLVTSNTDDRYKEWVREEKHHKKDDVSAGEGAVIGGIEGGIIGVALSLGALTIPGIGPVLAFGPIIGGLIGAGAGAATGGITAGLIDRGVPEEDAHTYAEAVRRGYVLVAVNTPESRSDEVEDIMHRYDAVDVDERASHWRSKGWERHDVNAKPLTRKDIDAEHRHYEDTVGKETIPVVEEELEVGKRKVDRGGVRVRSYMTSTPVEKDVKLKETKVDVERRPVDRPANRADLDNFEERDFELEETAEEAVVQKKPKVVEEVVVKKDVDVHKEKIKDKVRHTEVDVEKRRDRD